MRPLFSILHATYGRPAKAVLAMRMWLERAANPKAVEYIFACNEDDLAAHLKIIADAHEIYEKATGRLLKVVSGPFAGSAPAWDAAAKASEGLVLIQAQDDVEPPEGWDNSVWNALERSPGTTFLQFAEGPPVPYSVEPAFIAVSDGFRKDKLCCTAIMNRARYEQCGEFLHPGYISVFSDDDATIRAYADAAAGKCSLIEARDLVFLHRHHYHDKSVPMDATYERENSSAAYAHGQALFMKRNADLVAKGFKTW